MLLLVFEERELKAGHTEDLTLKIPLAGKISNTKEMVPLFLTEILLILPTLSALHFNCPPCHEISCPPVDPLCPTSEQVVGGPCGCCPVCGGVVWEKCEGAPWGENRPCLEGLVCKYRLGMTLGEEREGLCEPGTVSNTPNLEDSNLENPFKQEHD